MKRVVRATNATTKRSVAATAAATTAATTATTAATTKAVRESDFCLQKQVTRIAAGPSKNPADNFARRRAWRNNNKPIQPITISKPDPYQSRPQPGQTRATIGFAALIENPFECSIERATAALNFWRAWLTHPTLQELTVYITPTYTGIYQLAQETTTLIGSFWIALYECAYSAAPLSPALQSLRIRMVAAFDATSPIGALRVPAISAEMADHFNYVDAGNPSLAGSLLFSAVGCDSIGYKYRLDNHRLGRHAYQPFTHLTAVELPACFLSMENYVHFPRPLQEKWAEGYAVARTLRFVFPFAKIRADPYTCHIPATIDAATQAERTACVVNLRDMKLGRIRRVWYDMMEALDA